MTQRFSLLLVLALVAGCGDDEATTTTSTTSSGTGAGCDVCDAPADSDGMFTFLTAGDYTNWEKESAPHQSAGPHGNPVLTYISPTLATSLGASNAMHARGSAVVKEFFESDGTTVSGWAAWVKVESDSAGGDNIFWYEVFNTTENSAFADSLGASACTGCHGGGNDYLLTPYPLQ